MQRISNKTVNICGIQSSLEEAFEFCWSSLADERNTLPKSTRRHVKIDKFISGTPWLLNLLWKHWFALSVWNFCRWVADVPPRETSRTAKSEEKRMFSQTKKLCLNIKNLEKKIIYILIAALKFRKPEQNWAQIPENPKPPARPLSFRTSKSRNPDVNKTSH